MLAVGEHLFVNIDDQALRLLSDLGNSVVLVIQEPCGAFTSGMLVIGALHGKAVSEDRVSQSEQMALHFRQRFSEIFGSINCKDIRGWGSGSDGKDQCTELVERSTGILLQTLS